MGTDDLRDRLETVGHTFDLGQYETEAYLATLDNGRLTASECASAAGVPQTRIYDVLRALSDRGLVDLREGTPMEVVAIDPAETVGDVAESLSTAVAELATRYREPTREAAAASLVTSRRSILDHLGAVVETAEYELVLALPAALIERFDDELAAARARGVTVELLVAPARDAPDPSSFDYGRLCTLARSRRGITTPVIAVADGRRSVFTTRDALRQGDDRYGVIFNRSELGFLVHGFFDLLLASTTGTTLYRATGSDAFPRRFAAIRRAIAAVDAHGGQVYAGVEGRDVVTGDYRRVEGEVAEATLSDGGRVATMVLATDAGEVSVGGQIAAYEDVEAHRIALGVDGVPALD